MLATAAFFHMKDFSDWQRAWLSVSADLVVYLMCVPLHAWLLNTSYAPFVNWDWAVFIQPPLYAIFFIAVATLVAICPVATQQATMVGDLICNIAHLYLIGM